jgi:hypothetical protein
MERLKHFAHGECNLFEQKTLPAGAKEYKPVSEDIIRGMFILADSETEGNYHVIDDVKFDQNISFYVEGDQLYLKADKDFEIRCLNIDRHGPMAIPAGIYKKKIAKENDPFEKIKREVAD